VTQSEISKLELQLKEYNIYMSEREEMNHENSNLKKTVDAEKEERIKEVADK
jgi:cell shape-determining protein MreC